MTHAMVITGLDLDERGKPRKWRVENSWGASIGDQGFMYMMDEWFDQYLYEAVVRKEYLSPEPLKSLDTEPVVLSSGTPCAHWQKANPRPEMNGSPYVLDIQSSSFVCTKKFKETC